MRLWLWPFWEPFRICFSFLLTNRRCVRYVLTWSCVWSSYDHDWSWLHLVAWWTLPMTGRSEGHHRGTARSSTEQHIKVNSGSTRFNRFMLTRGFFRFYENYVPLCSLWGIFRSKLKQQSYRNYVLQLRPSVMTCHCSLMCLPHPLSSVCRRGSVLGSSRVHTKIAGCAGHLRRHLKAVQDGAGWCYMVSKQGNSNAHLRKHINTHKHMWRSGHVIIWNVYIYIINNNNK